MKLRRVAILSCVFVCCFSITAPAFADTLMVDNDFADCPQAKFNSIQEAVLFATPGDKILVCPGVYLETVEVTKTDLRIKAQAGPGQVVLQAPAGAVVPPFGFHLLNTTGVLVQGFTVQRFGDANIRIEGGSGNTLRKNITTAANASGIRVINSSANVVEQNTSFANQGGGITVTSTVTAPESATSDNIIRRNETYSNGQAGLQILIIPPAVGTLSGNVLFGNDSHDNPIGIRNVQSAHGSVIENNRVFSNNWGIIVGLSRDVTVRNNRSESNTEFGIRLQNGANNNVVEKNEVFHNTQDGIRLEGGPIVVEDNIVQLNHVQRNGRDGIRANALTAENTIERNVIRESGEHDAHDDSAGPGTGGTANIWIDNKCETENRPGLCEHAAH